NGGIPSAPLQTNFDRWDYGSIAKLRVSLDLLLHAKNRLKRQWRAQLVAQPEYAASWAQCLHHQTPANRLPIPSARCKEYVPQRQNHERNNHTTYHRGYQRNHPVRPLYLPKRLFPRKAP